MISLCRQIHQEFQIQLCELTAENLLEQFALNKHTGLEKPGRWETLNFETILQQQQQQQQQQQHPHSPRLGRVPSSELPSYATVPRSRMSKKRKRGKKKEDVAKEGEGDGCGGGTSDPLTGTKRREMLLVACSEGRKVFFLNNFQG